MKDHIERELAFEKPLTLNSKGYLNEMPEYPGSSDLIFTIDWSFSQTQYVIDFYSTKDIISSLGGILALFSAAVNGFAPLFGLIFYLKLASIIKEQNNDAYREYLKKFITRAQTTFAFFKAQR